MAFRVLFLAHAPDGDASSHRATISTPGLHLTAMFVRDQAQAVRVVKEVASGGLDSVLLCPGFTHEQVAEIAEAAGDGVGVSVARGDGRSMAMAHKAMEREGWFGGV